MKPREHFPLTLNMFRSLQVGLIWGFFLISAAFLSFNTFTVTGNVDMKPSGLKTRLSCTRFMSVPEHLISVMNAETSKSAFWANFQGSHHHVGQVAVPGQLSGSKEQRQPHLFVFESVFFFPQNLNLFFSPESFM